jgi:hypothetical protein
MSTKERRSVAKASANMLSDINESEMLLKHVLVFLGEVRGVDPLLT